MVPQKNENKISLEVANGDGDSTVIDINVHAPLRQLLAKAVKDLYGDDRVYVLFIDGTEIEDLSQSLEDAGVDADSDLVVMPAEVNRG